MRGQTFSKIHLVCFPLETGYISSKNILPHLSWALELIGKSLLMLFY